MSTRGQLDYTVAVTIPATEEELIPPAAQRNARFYSKKNSNNVHLSLRETTKNDQLLKFLFTKECFWITGWYW